LNPTVAPWALTNLISNPTPPVTLEPPIPQSTFSAKDEFAVRGLLALGTRSGSESISASASASASAGTEHDLALGAASRSPPPLPANTPGRTIPGHEISPGFIDGILGISSTPVPASAPQPAAHHPSALGIDVDAPSSSHGHDHGNSFNQSHSYNHSHEVGSASGNPGSETWKMKLLQHYRYNVAPWVRSLCLAYSVHYRRPGAAEIISDRIASSISAI
jgi:hypothetical protein